MTAAPVQVALLNALRGAAGGIVTRDELVNIAYDRDPEGGPLEAGAAVRGAIKRLRRRGFPIRSVLGHRGYFYEAARP